MDTAIRDTMKRAVLALECLGAIHCDILDIGRYMVGSPRHLGQSFVPRTMHCR